MQSTPPPTPNHQIWCLARNEARPFLIRISPKRYIYDLEQEVRLSFMLMDDYRRRKNNVGLMKVRISQASRSPV